MNINEILENNSYRIYNYELAKKVGIHEAILLSDLVFRYALFNKNGDLTPDGFFYVTVLDMFNTTALTKRNQATSIKHLTDFGLLEYKLIGLPAKRYFKLNQEGLFALFSKEDRESDKNKIKIKQEKQELEVGKDMPNVVDFVNNTFKKISPAYIPTTKEDNIIKRLLDQWGYDMLMDYMDKSIMISKIKKHFERNGMEEDARYIIFISKPSDILEKATKIEAQYERLQREYELTEEGIIKRGLGMVVC